MNIQLQEEKAQVNLASLYEQDYYLWLTTTAEILKSNNLSKLDLPNLIEEIQDMARSEKNALKSNLRIIIMHLLKYKYQPEKRTNSWRYTIREHRLRIREAFRNSPSLKPYFARVFAECYEDARKLAADETGLPLNTFPDEPMFTPEQTLDPEYLPSSARE